MSLQGSNSKEIQTRSVANFYSEQVNRVIVELKGLSKEVSDQFEYYSYYKCSEDEAQIGFLKKRSFIIDCTDKNEAISVVELLGIKALRDEFNYKIDQEPSEKFKGILVTLLDNGVAIQLTKDAISDIKTARQNRKVANLAESPQINYCRNLSRKDYVENISELINVQKLKETEFDLTRVLLGNSFDPLIEAANKMRQLVQIQASESVLEKRFNLFKNIITDFEGPIVTKSEFLGKLATIKKEINFVVELNNLSKILGMSLRFPNRKMSVVVDKDEYPNIMRNVFFETISVDK